MTAMLKVRRARFGHVPCHGPVCSENEVHPDLPEHHVALPTRMDCATTDPVQKLDRLSRSLGFPICDPTP